MKNQEVSIKKEFNKWAKTYDVMPCNYCNFYFTNKKVISVLNPKTGSSFLDVGCGTGILLEQLAKLNKDLELSGLDLSEEMLSVARQKLEKYFNVNLRLGSVAKLPFKDNYFDYVTCVHSFHHHPDSLKSLKEMKRVLKPGGKLLLADVSLDGPFRSLFQVFEQRLFPKRESDIQRYTKAKMKELFENAGFKNIKQDYFIYFVLFNLGEK
jgi:demethylmenaquinone methyltransferase/2-methoxy-6-polyprenyl-1,4-benzoquinol methylase